MLWTTADLVTTIVTRGQFPDTTNAKTISSPANLLLLATEELRISLLPLILDATQEYYVKPLDIPVVAGQAAYPLPTRSVASGLRSIRLVNGSSDLPFVHVNRDQIPTRAPGQATGYYFENNNVILDPTPTTAQATIRTAYFIRPSRLELVANCAKVLAFDPVANTVTVDAAPGTWGVGTNLDFIAQVVPYAARAIDQAPTAVSGTLLTFAALPSDLAVNDYLAPAEYTPLPQMPEEFQPVLAEMVIAVVHAALGNKDGIAASEKRLKDLIPNAQKLITKRDYSHPKKIVGTGWRRRVTGPGYVR